MIRHRVHLIVTAEQLERPISFRTDVILAERDPDKARTWAEVVLINQDPLTCARILSSSMEMTEV